MVELYQESPLYDLYEQDARSAPASTLQHPVPCSGTLYVCIYCYILYVWKMCMVLYVYDYVSIMYPLYIHYVSIMYPCIVCPSLTGWSFASSWLMNKPKLNGALARSGTLVTSSERQWKCNKILTEVIHDISVVNVFFVHSFNKHAMQHAGTGWNLFEQCCSTSDMWLDRQHVTISRRFASRTRRYHTCFSHCHAMHCDVTVFTPNLRPWWILMDSYGFLWILMDS